jgi:D-serine deaminase-like pyridoxal phosphate-dependent protein
MSPQLVRRQLDAGAWGATVATVAQAAVFRAAGVGDRLLLANQLVDPAGVRWLAEQLAERAFDFYCLVDSIAAVDRLAALLRSAGAPRPVSVLVELGVDGGRTGARTPAEALDVARAAAAAPGLVLAGVECFEGVVSSRDAAGDFVQRLRELYAVVAGEGHFDGRDEVVVSAGGSAFFDRVVDVLEAIDSRARVVLRSGCYVTHDHGFYARMSPFADGADGPVFRPALELWSHVLSTPEPGLFIAGFGKRDAPYDLDLPVPLRLLRGGIGFDASGCTVTALNDQHAFVSVPQGLDVGVGDMLVCGISHPCTAFDKWSLIPLVDDDDRVIDAIRTYF